MNRLIDEVLAPIATNTYPRQELEFMFDALQRLRPACIFEWGTNIGKSARVFHEIAKHIGLQTKIYSTDLPRSSNHIEHAKGLTGSLVKGCENVFLFEGDGLQVTLNACHEPQPLVFIDGDHLFDSVRRDLAGIVYGIPDANILLHDTGYALAPDCNIGPYLAIEDVLAALPGAYKRTATEGFPGMTLLVKASL